MKHTNIHQKLRGFTLVEVIITLTIFSLIFTSVMSIFIYYTSLGNRVEANRLMQTNVKTVIEHITEDVRINGIKTSEDIVDPNEDHHKIISWKYADDTEYLYVWENSYFLGLAPDYNKLDYTECEDVQKPCSLVKQVWVWWEKIPLTNSWVAVRKLRFDVSEDAVDKVTMNFEIGISYNKWLKSWLVQNSYFPVQATISEKLTDQ